MTERTGTGLLIDVERLVCRTHRGPPVGYYGIAGNIRALQRVHRAVERYWRIMLSSRSWKGQVLWKQFQQIKERFPLARPKLYLPYSELQAIAVL